jgi:hypothetical protein
MGLDKKKKYILLKALKYGKEKLGVTKPFTLKLSDSREGFKTTGYYDPDKYIIAAYINNRAICDIVRSTLHELVHHFDNVSGRIKGNEPDVGKFDHQNIDPNDVENRANSIAGAIVKEFSYKLKDEEGIDIYTS